MAWVNGASNAAAAATSVAVSYSPVVGGLVIVFVAVGGAVTGLQVSDDLGNFLAPGPTGATTPYQAAGTGYLYSFWGLAAAGANAYTATWVTAQDSAIVLGEYSSVGSIDFTLAATHASGTSTTPAITPTSTQANSIFVAGMMDNSSDGLPLHVSLLASLAHHVGVVRCQFEAVGVLLSLLRLISRNQGWRSRWSKCSLHISGDVSNELF